VNTGLGISEIILICTLVLILFGSKEIPQFIRVVAKFLARIRHYSDTIKNEIDNFTQSIEIPQGIPIVPEHKNDLRKQYLQIGKELPEAVRLEKSSAIFEFLKKSPHFQNADSIMIYVNIGSEVETRSIIKHLLEKGKRVIVPYCKDSSGELGISEIHSLENDICKGPMGVPEVQPHLRKTFFKTDLQLIICPGVAFDTFGGRLGRGKSSYDRFLKEVKGQVPIIGLGFNCQICRDPLPFDYHDIPMDQIITESGALLGSQIKIATNSLEQLTAGRI
jgi:5-formyltetrahydrofolate cyclo-ligase